MTVVYSGSEAAEDSECVYSKVDISQYTDTYRRYKVGELLTRLKESMLHVSTVPLTMRQIDEIKSAKYEMPDGT